MKFKVINKKYLVLGLILFGVSATYIGADRYYNQKELELLAEEASDWSITLLPSESDKSSLPKTDELVSQEVIESVSGDQEVEAVTSYVNCISIPELDILAKINEGVDSDALHRGVGHFEDTVLPGEIGNFAIAGHSSDTYNCILNKIKEISLYDEIDVYDSWGTKYTYTVISTTVVQPDYLRVLDTVAGSDDRLMTIVTCVDNGQRRFIVKAQILTDEEVEVLKTNQRNKMLDTARQYNNTIPVSHLYEYFKDSSFISEYRYKQSVKANKVSYWGTRNTIRYNLYSPVLGDKAVEQPHKYPDDFQINIGFSINEGEVII